MLRRLNKLAGFAIHTTGGKAGHVEDFYFDIKNWNIRYLVVKTGPWLFGRNVLISLAAVEGLNWTVEEVFLNLTKEEVENSPELVPDMPVTRQYEHELNSYYGWPNYWAMDPAVTTLAPGPFVPIEAGKGAAEAARAHAGTPGVEQVREDIAVDHAPEESAIRSVKDVQGYTLHASDKEFGYLEDFFADENDWKIRYALVDTSRWLGGKHVLISPEWIDDIDWAGRLVRVHVDYEKIKNSPEYDAGEPLHREHEVELYSYYEYPHYWGV